MKNPKTVCKEHGLHGLQAQRGAELMAQAIAEDVLHILMSYDVRPIHERIAQYFDFKNQNNKQ